MRFRKVDVATRSRCYYRLFPSELHVNFGAYSHIDRYEHIITTAAIQTGFISMSMLPFASPTSNPVTNSAPVSCLSMSLIAS